MDIQSSPYYGAPELIAFHNPRDKTKDQIEAHKAKMAESYADGLEALDIPHLRFIPTEPTVAATYQTLSRSVPPGAAMGLHAGDGSTEIFLAAHCQWQTGTDSSLELGQLPLYRPVALVGGGHANDLAHMLHPRAALHNLSALLVHSRTAQIRPIQTTTQAPGETTKTSLAYSYYTIGLTAHLAAEFDQARLRSLTQSLPKLVKIAVQAKVTLQELVYVEPFILDEAGEQRSLYDRVYMNGSLMAIFTHSRQPLLEPGIACMDVPASHRANYASRIFQLARGQNRTLGEDDRDEFSVSSNNHLIFEQRGGEAKPVTNGTAITVGIAPEDTTVSVLTSRKRRP